MIWTIIANVSSICSIIGLPIALFQIAKIKSKAEETELGLKRLLDMKDNENMEKISATIYSQQQDLSQIQAAATKEGTSLEKLDDRCRNIINELNLCVFQIPSRYENATKRIERTIKSIQEYLQWKNIERLKDASDYLYTTIRLLKKENDEFINRQVKDIAKK